MEEYDDVLDKEDKPGRVNYINWMFGIAIVLFVYWYVGGFMQWPYPGLGLLAGLVILLVVMVARFIETSSKKLHNYLYFAGKISLIGAIYLYLMHGPHAMWFVWGAFGFFAGGILALSFQSR